MKLLQLVNAEAKKEKRKRKIESGQSRITRIGKSNVLLTNNALL